MAPFKLLNVAGLLHDVNYPRAPERSLKDMNRDWLQRTLEVNTVGPIMLIAALEPLLKLPRRPSKGASDRAPSVVASVSARVGSIGDNGLGGWHSYRVSKAALNMATKSASNELKRHQAWCVALHPGTTDTDLSKPFQKNVKPDKLFTREFSVSQMLGEIGGTIRLSFLLFVANFYNGESPDLRLRLHSQASLMPLRRNIQGDSSLGMGVRFRGDKCAWYRRHIEATELTRRAIWSFNAPWPSCLFSVPLEKKTALVRFHFFLNGSLKSGLFVWLPLCSESI